MQRLVHLTAIIVMLILIAGCGGDASQGAPVTAGAEEPDGEGATGPPVASVDLSDPVRNEALDELDAILAADQGPEPVPQIRTSEPEPAPQPTPTVVPAPSQPPTPEATPEPTSEEPEPSFTPDVTQSSGPIVLADQDGVRILAEPIGLHLYRLTDPQATAMARWPERTSGEAFASHVVHDRFDPAQVALVDPDSGQQLAADAYTVAAADGWVILVEGDIAGHSYERADGFIMTRSVSPDGTEGWFVAGDSQGSTLFVFPTADGQPVRADLSLLL